MIKDKQKEEIKFYDGFLYRIENSYIHLICV